MSTKFFCLVALLSTPAFADETRHLDSHEHGVGQLNIAMDSQALMMEFHAPGADIVGFEYSAERAEDRTAIDRAVAMLARPLDLFVLPAAAECNVIQANAALEQEEHDEHAEHHDDAHDEDVLHSEFHAAYTFACGNPSAITEIVFAYFDAFPNALEVEVQVVSAAGAQRFEVERENPELDLRGLF